MKDYHMPEQVCPSCGWELDHAADMHAAPRPPEPGDVSLCIECETWLMFDDNMMLHIATPAKLAEVADLPDVREVAARIRFAKTRNN